MLCGGSETDCVGIFAAYNIWKQSVKTMRVSCLLRSLYNHNSSYGTDGEAQASVYTLSLEHITAEMTSVRLA